MIVLLRILNGVINYMPYDSLINKIKSFNNREDILSFYCTAIAEKSPELKTRIIKNCINLCRLPKIERILIETVNYCNHNCPFCPIGLGMNTDEQIIMTDDKFKRIIDMINEYDSNWNGILSVFGQGEPLLDKDIFDRINYTKERLPRCKILLGTNGILLPDRMKELIKSKLDYIIINFYTPRTERECYDAFLKYKLKFTHYLGKLYGEENKLNIFFRRRFNLDGSPKYEDWYTNRAGALNDIGEEVPNSPCILPFFQLPITVTGGIRYCSYDALGLTVFDNIFNYDKLYDLWNSDKRKDIMNKIVESRMNLEHCNKCNTNDCQICQSLIHGNQLNKI